VGQLLVESLLLASLAGLAAALAADFAHQKSLAALQRMVPVGLSVLDHSPFHAMGLGWSVLLILAATISIGLLPALRLSRQGLPQLMRIGDDSAGSWHEGTFLRSLLVIAQVACAVLLLFVSLRLWAAAGLAQAVPLGFETRNRVVVEVDLGMLDFPREKRVAAHQAMLASVRVAPGVRSAGFGTLLPLANLALVTEVRRSEAEAAGLERAIGALRNDISTEYFATLGIPLLEGRAFTPEDAEVGGGGRARVAVVNRSLADRIFADGKAVGRKLLLGDVDAEEGRQEVEIVGVVGNTRHDGGSILGRRQVYLPYGPLPVVPIHMHVELEPGRWNNLEDAAQAVVRALRSAVPGAPVVYASPLEQAIQRDILENGLRLLASVSAFLAALAILLTLVGVYGLKAYTLHRRAREIGIRYALGETPRGMLRILFRQTVIQLLIGLALGGLASWGTAAALARIIPDTGKAILPHLLPAVLLAALAAVAATWLPARRALRLSPATILRAD
jgi:predicted permease